MRQRFLWVITLITALAAPFIQVPAADYLTGAEALLAKGELRAAEIQLKNAVRSDPTNMAAHYRLAVVQLQLGEAAAAQHEAGVARDGGYDPEHTIPLLAETYLAQQKYRQVLDEFPGNEGSEAQRTALLVARGYAQFALGSLEEARVSFQSAEKLSPDAVGPILGQAKLLLSAREYAAAEPIIDRVLKLDPKSLEGRIAKVRLLRFNGKINEALEALNELISERANFLPARLERAEILLSQDHDLEAKADVDAVLAAQPGSVAGIYLNAVLAVKGKDFEKANNELEKISKALSAIPRGYYLQALVSYNLHHLEQAEDAARRFVVRNPDDFAGEKLLGAIELGLGRPADTVDALSRFENDGKIDAGALDLLGRAYTQLGKTSEALSAFAAAVKLAPNDAALRARLGGTQLRAGHTTEGVTDLEQSLEIGPSAPAAEMLVLTELASGNWENGVEAAKKLKQAQPDTPVPDNLLGLIDLARFDLTEAYAKFSGLAAAHPHFLPARLNMARVLELQGKPDEAEQVLQKILSDDPTNAAALARIVDLCLRRGKTDSAVAALEHAHAAAPANQGITASLIDLYVRKGDNDKALALARQENGDNDKLNVPVIAARARAELAAGLKKEAAETYRRLIEIAPAQIAFRRQLAAVLASTGDLASAEQTIQKAMQLAPHNPELAADRIAIDLKSSGVAGAVATARELRNQFPDLPTAAALEGDTYMAAGEYIKATEAYSEALKNSPSEMLVTRLARAKTAEGDADAATHILREWVAAHPSDSGVAATLATSDLSARRFDQATKELEALSIERPRDPVVLNNLAWLYHRSGDPRARSLAERAYLLSPNLPQVGDTLGWILVQQGQAASALGLLRQASLDAPTNADIRYHLAVALNDVGQREDALHILREIVENNTSFDEKAAAEKLLTELSKG